MAEAPPSYNEVVSGPSSTSAVPSDKALRNETRNGIPASHRRSMEDASRPLPDGWVRQFDAKNAHQYFVDTKANPPRSIWHHPYDDDQYLETLPSAERERIQEITRHPSMHDIVAEDSDSDDGHDHHSKKTAGGASASHSNQLPPRPTAQKQKTGFGRKLKDKITGSTHEQREAERQKRAADERKAYEAHQAFRAAVQKAMDTGEPQFLAKDTDGKDVYIEPPAGPMAASGGGYGHGAYSNPNARYVSVPTSAYGTPQQAYGRPYGRGYGGGYGLPLAGGLMGGLLLGDVMFGGMGMGGMGMGMGMGGMGMGGMGMGGGMGM